MTRFIELSPILQGMIGLVAVGQFLYAFMHIVISYKRKNRISILILLFELTLLYMEIQFVAAFKSAKHGNFPLFYKMLDGFLQIPILYIVLFMIVITVAEALQSMEYRVWRKNNITDVSIKEALDDLPAGVCYYDKTGRVILKNKSMEVNCRVLTGKALLNGLSFQSYIDDNIIYLGDVAMLFMPDQKVYSVTQKTLLYGEREIVVLITMDITEQYSKIQSLRQKQNAVQMLNEQLVAYGKEIVSVINAKEILNAKVKLHDELGVNLLAIKHFIVNGGTDAELENIKEGLMQNVQYLRQETVQNDRDEYKMILETAEKLNVKVNVTGDFPNEEPIKSILVTGIHECLTNTIRHAHGTEMMVEIKNTEQAITAIFTNNGEQPIKKIQEKGGLASLRTLVENNNGSMIIRSKGKFVLIVNFAKSKNRKK